MAFELKVDANYVVVTDTATSEIRGSFPINHCAYRETDDTFVILENIDTEVETILKTDIALGLWVDASAVAFTESTLRQWLRVNTGFKSAGGGSSAIGDLLTKTGQTTSYRTGDDGDIEAGRLSSFDRLKADNPFGNDFRFSDELGTQTYANNIVIDWSTYDGSEVLGYYVGDNTTNRLWDDAIDWGVALSVGTFTSGWRLANVLEYINVCDYGQTSGYPLNYAPFNTNFNLWTSTTVAASTGRAYRYQGYAMETRTSTKSSGSYATIATRNFTVSGTTLS